MYLYEFFNECDWKNETIIGINNNISTTEDVC